MPKGIPVVISENGYGIPVTPVESGAPSMIVAKDGLGTPIVITSNGAPFVVDGIGPDDPKWQTFFIIAGNNAFGWGYAIPPLVSAPLGDILNEPYTGSNLIAFFEAPDDSRIIVCFSGNLVSELTGYTFNINGATLDVMTPPVYDAVNDWTIMYLESFWMIEGQGYVIYRVEATNVFSPSELFANGEQGAWYDPSDLSTVFQNTTGTIPALPGDPVGWALDKSGNVINLSQTTASARPTLARMPKTGRRNTLEYTEDFSNAYWQLFGGGVKEAGNRLVSTGQTRPRTQSSTITRVFPVGTNVNFSVDVYPDAGLAEVYLQVRQINEAGIAGLPSVQSFAFASLVNTAGVSEKLDGNGWRLFVKGTSTVEVDTIRFGIALGNTTDAVPNGMGARVTRFQATFSLEATPYQKVTNAFDVTEAGVPDVWYLQGDGIDDALNATIPAGQYTRAFCNADGTVTIEEDISISGQENILRVNQLVGIIYVRRDLTTIEKQLLTQYWKAKSYE